MADSKVSIRFGIKNSGWLPNAGIFVIKVNAKAAAIIVLGFDKLREELKNSGNSDIASKLVAEYRP